MSSEVKRREPGQRVSPSRQRPKLVLVPPAPKPRRPDVKIELSPEVKEMLRELNRRHTSKRNIDEPDAA